MSATFVTPNDLDEISGVQGEVLLAGGTEVVPQLRSGLLDADTIVDISALVPRGIDGARIGAGTTLAEIEASETVPAALREACRLAASPQLRSMGTVGGNLLQSTRCWYWRLGYNCHLRGGDHCNAREGEHREHAIFGNGFCASAHPSDVAAALAALGARVRTSRRELAVTELYRLPEAADPRLLALEPGEVLLELEVPPAEASVYLKAMDRKRFGFPLVGVAAVRRSDRATVALAGVAPIPWVLQGSLDEATPLPGTAWKVATARALVSRALGTIERG
jgi:xanthine dehydrogenase YagS FAD-binding subunit